MKLKGFYVNDREIYNALMNSIDDYVYIGDLTTNKYLVSQNMLDDFELPGRLVENLPEVWGKLIHEKDQARFFASIQDMLAGRLMSHNEEYQICNRQGQYVWVHCRGILNRGQDGGPVSFIGVVKKPASMGKLDAITGLYTHEKYLEMLEVLRDNGMLSNAGLLMLGIDDFVRINTLKTHHFGDIVLRSTAQDLMKILPGGTQLYRFDGDQFAILLEDGNAEALSAAYDKVQKYTSDRHIADNQEYTLTISGGAVCFSEIEEIGENADKCASVALGEAKLRGKNQCVFFSPGMLDYQMREQKLLQEMGQSVRNQFAGFFLEFQPIADTATMKITGAEALLRFQSRHYGLIRPDEFIPMLEHAGLILPVGRWVLSKAVETCARWRTMLPDFTINVNVSCLQFKEKNFPAIVEEELKRFGLPPGNLTLEMTETYFVTDIVKFADALGSLHRLGCKIAMDDFGTGYSSLGRLTEFDIDVVKIDRLFVKSLNANHYNYRFVEAVISLCHRAGMEVCVEGVETDSEQQGVRDLFADSLQGFYVSRPVPEEVFERIFIGNPYCMAEKAGLQSVPPHYRKMSGDKDLLLLMMDATPLCMNLWNRDYQNVECNKAAVRLFEMKNEEEYLDRFFELSPEYQPDGEPSLKKARDKVKEAFEQGNTVFFWMHQKLNGEQIPCEITLSRLCYQNDFVVAGYTRDLRSQVKYVS